MKDFTVGRVKDTLFPFLVPMLFNNFISQFYLFIDTAIVGHFLGKEALSATGGIFPILFVIFTVVIGYQVGATTLTAKFFVLKDYDKIKKIIGTIVLTMTLLGLIIGVVGYFSAEFLLKLISLPENLIPLSKQYFRVLILGSVFSYNYYALENILQALGNSKVPLFLTIAYSGLNIIGDLVFVLVFHWGVFGVGLATVLANFIVLVLAIFYINKKVKIFKINFKLKFDLPTFKEISKIGLPTVGQMLGISTSFFVGQNFINRFGVDIIAATTVGSRINSIIKMFGVAVSAAMTTYVSQNYAKKLYDRIKKAVNYVIVLMLTLAFVLMFFSLMFPEFLLKIFTSDPDVIEKGVIYLKISAPFYFIFASTFVFTGLMRGVGKTIYTMIISLFSLWGVKLILIILLAYKIDWSTLTLIPVNYKGLWWAYVFSNITEAFLYVVLYLSGKWK